MDSVVLWINICLLFLYIAAGIMILEGFDMRARGLRRILYPLALAAVLTANLYVFDAYGLERYLLLYPLLSFLPLFLTSLLITRYRGVKTLFVFLTATIWASPLLLAAHAVSLLFGPAPLVKLIAYIAVSVPMLLLLKLYFKPPLLYLLDNYHKGWALFCAVPLLCASVSYYQTRYRFMLDLGTFRETGIWQFALSLLSFMTYLLIVQYARQIRERLEAKGTYELLQTQHRGALLHIASLRQSQRQSAVYLHDLRHHLRYIHSLAMADNREEIMKYVAGVERGIDASPKRAFCKNETVNLILSCFEAQAVRLGVAGVLRADGRENVSIPDADLCVIISIALENAIEAADAAGDRPKVVEFACRTRNGQLLLEIANPYAGEVCIEGDTVRANGGSGGLGTRSIALLVENHAGILSFEAQGGRFVLRAIL